MLQNEIIYSIYMRSCARLKKLQTSLHVAMLLLMKLKIFLTAVTYSAKFFLKPGRKRRDGNISVAKEKYLKNFSTSDMSIWNAGSEWSNRWPNIMFMMTLATHEKVSCFMSKGRPCWSRTLLIISSASIKILVSITLWPNPNRFRIDRQSLRWVRNSEL